MTDSAATQKSVDTYNFIKAEDFFKNLDQVASSGEQASDISDFTFNTYDELCSRRLILHFGNGRAVSLRFIRPQVWRLLCNLEPEDCSAKPNPNT